MSIDKHTKTTTSYSSKTSVLSPLYSVVDIQVNLVSSHFSKTGQSM